MRKNNDLISLFVILVITFGIMMSAFIFAVPHQKEQPKQEKTSFVEKIFDTYFEKEMGCSIEEFTSELAKIE